MGEEVINMQNNNHNNNQKLEELLRQLSQKMGTEPDKLRSSAQKGDVSQVVSGLRPEDAQKVQKVLSDKDAQEKLLATPQAQMLLKKLLEGK